MYYSRYGEPITLEEFIEEMPRKVLRQTFVRQYLVSTIYLGLDFNVFRGLPAIFETMVFDDTHGSLDLECQRYPTLTAAHLGHAEVLSMVLHIIGAERSEIHLDIDSRPALTGGPVYTVTPALIGGMNGLPLSP